MAVHSRYTVEAVGAVNPPSQYVPHRAELRFTRNLSGEVEKKVIDRSDYVPCAAVFAYWPETKAQWDAGALWAIHLCEKCAAKDGLVW